MTWTTTTAGAWPGAMPVGMAARLLALPRLPEELEARRWWQEWAALQVVLPRQLPPSLTGLYQPTVQRRRHRLLLGPLHPHQPSRSRWSMTSHYRLSRCLKTR